MRSGSPITLQVLVLSSQLSSQLFTLHTPLKPVLIFFALQPSSTSVTDLLGVLSSYLFDRNSLELRVRLTAPTKEAAQFKLWDGQRNCHNFRRTTILRRQRLNLAILGSILSPQIRLLSRCRGKCKTPHLRIVQFNQYRSTQEPNAKSRNHLLVAVSTRQTQSSSQPISFAFLLAGRNICF